MNGRTRVVHTFEHNGITWHVGTPKLDGIRVWVPVSYAAHLQGTVQALAPVAFIEGLVEGVVPGWGLNTGGIKYRTAVSADEPIGEGLYTEMWLYA